MERRFTVRKRQMLEECEVSVNVFRGMLERLESFFQRYCQKLTGRQKGLPTLALVSTFVRCAAEFDGSLAAASGRIGMIHR